MKRTIRRGEIMDLLERYLQAVAQYLPLKGKEDTVAELPANLLAEIENREEELGRPLLEGEVGAVLQQHGRPVLVAARYLPQRFLIGPGLFPLYWFTLLKSFPLMVLAYTVAQAANFLFGGGVTIGAAIGHFPYVAFTFWSVMTLGFAVFEFAQGRYFAEVKWTKAWNPQDLPALTPEKGQSFANRVADLIVSVLMILWLLSVPTHPYLVLGPGGSLRGLPFGLSPEWHILYWQIIGLLVIMLPLKIAALFRGAAKWRRGLELATQAIGILVLVVLVQARTYFAPVSSGERLSSLANLASVNYSVNLGFKIALVVMVVKFVWDLWQAIVGARSGQKGFVTVF
jgi:hypothetical protein